MISTLGRRVLEAIVMSDLNALQENCNSKFFEWSQRWAEEL